MQHLTHCDFRQRIEQLQDGSWRDGDGEISGYVNIGEDKISFNDGWNCFPNIEFVFCPICGIKISDDELSDKHPIIIRLVPTKEMVDFIKENNLDLIVTEREINLYTVEGMPRFYAEFAGGAVEVGKAFVHPIGNGNTVDEAISDYCNKISLTTMEFPKDENKFIEGDFRQRRYNKKWIEIPTKPDIRKIFLLNRINVPMLVHTRCV